MGVVRFIFSVSVLTAVGGAAVPGYLATWRVWLSATSAQHAPANGDEPSVEVFPAPWRGRGAVGLLSETELIREAVLLEEPEHARYLSTPGPGCGMM